MAKKIDKIGDEMAKSDPMGAAAAKTLPRKTPKKTPARKYQKYQRPRGGPAKSISDLMPEIGRAAFRRYGFIQSSVVSRWAEIVGDRYAAVSLPESIRFPRGEKEGGTLHLVVGGAYVTMMQHIAPDIIERVNRFFGYGAVSQIRFRQGTVTPKEDKEKRAVLPRSLRPAPIQLGENLRDIGDAELNRVLESLASAVAKAEAEPRNDAKLSIKVIGKIGGGDRKKDET